MEKKTECKVVQDNYIKKYSNKLKSLKLALISIPMIIFILVVSYCLSEGWTVKTMDISSWYVKYNTIDGTLDWEHLEQ